MSMRTSRTWVAGLGCLLAAGLLTVTGCRQTCNHCCGDSCGVGGSSAAPAPAAAGGYAGQRTCPVTGAELAAGKAVPVSAKGETIYVCCQGCALKVRLNPDAYLAKVHAERAGGSAPLAVTPLGGQRNCPVTGEPLDPASAVAVNVGGQTVYVCCQGCAAKVRQNPTAYLAKVTAERTTQVSAGR